MTETELQAIESRYPNDEVHQLAARVRELEAEVALWKKVTGRDDAEGLDFALGRAGIDYHIDVLTKMRNDAQARVRELEAECTRRAQEQAALRVERDEARKTEALEWFKAIGGCDDFECIAGSLSHDGRMGALESGALAKERDALKADVERLTRERDEAEAADECQVDGRPSCHGDGKTDADWCRACLLARYRVASAERDGYAQQASALRRERAEAHDKYESSNKARHWLIQRLNEECAKVGFDLMWTDGGGSQCPGGWHRNPYLNRGDIHAELAEARATAERYAKGLAINEETLAIVEREGDEARATADLNAAARDAAAAEAHNLRARFAMNEPWPLVDVLDKLAEFADTILDHGYDGHGHEEARHVATRAHEFAAAIRTALSQPSAADAVLASIRAEAIDLYRRRRVMHRDTERGREVVSFDTPEDWLAEYDASNRADERKRCEADAHALREAAVAEARAAALLEAASMASKRKLSAMCIEDRVAMGNLESDLRALAATPTPPTDAKGTR